MMHPILSRRSAQVWLAKKKSTGDVMAVKAMRKEHLRNTDQVTSINVEHAILAKHDSEFLVRAFYSFRSAHHVYFALEYMPGGDLSSMLAECGCIAEPSAAFYVGETLLGMHYLHTERILHRDIKPSNCLISASGHIKLADFGLSTSMMQHKKCGTLPYVAPEVLRSGSASEALDHWATGVLLYELIAGEPPFSGDTPKQMLQNIMETTLDMRPLSPVAASLIRSLLQVDPALRLGASGFEEIQGHAFFAFTQWDNMLGVTPYVAGSRSFHLWRARSLSAGCGVSSRCLLAGGWPAAHPSTRRYRCSPVDPLDRASPAQAVCAAARRRGR
jgi:serine/threonine protein kinase